MGKQIRNAVVVEGGGMRGIFAAGILDTFYEKNFDPFDAYYGVSAGACNLASHLGKQPGRNYRSFTKYMRMKPFFSKKKFLRGGHYMDLDWLWEYLYAHEPLNAAAASKKNLIVVSTDVKTGKPVYTRARKETLADYLKASSSLPMLYRGFVEVEGKMLTDGGISDSIPVARAVDDGAKRIMVIRSRPDGYVKKSVLESRIIPKLFGKYPELKAAMKCRENVYNESIEYIKNPPDGVEIIEICPGSLHSGRTTKKIYLLDADYAEGKRAGLRAIDRWKKT